MTKKYWKMRALAKDEAEILIYEVIGEDFFDKGITSKQFVDDLKALGDIRKLVVRINSPGGDVFEGNTIYNILRNHRAKIEVHIDGIAASIASVVAMAGDKIIMPENAMMMIHNPWGVVAGNADDMRKFADSLDKIKTSLVVAYREKTGLSKQRIDRLMTEETWFTAAEAVRDGFADEITERVRMAAKFDLTMYKNAPRELAGTRQPGRRLDEQARKRTHEARRRELELLEAEMLDVPKPAYCPKDAGGRRQQLNRLYEELSGPVDSRFH